MSADVGASGIPPSLRVSGHEIVHLQEVAAGYPEDLPDFASPRARVHGGLPLIRNLRFDARWDALTFRRVRHR